MVGGKVLKSGPSDTVFVYYADHGAPGLVTFLSNYMYAHQLVTAFNYMQGMYEASGVYGSMRVGLNVQWSFTQYSSVRYYFG